MPKSPEEFSSRIATGFYAQSLPNGVPAKASLLAGEINPPNAA
jgi:hypothetical protein